PFVVNPNNSYKRGLELEKIILDESDKPLYKVINTYHFTEFQKMLGITVFYPRLDCPWASSYLNYQSYKNAISSSTCENSIPCGNTSRCGSDSKDFIWFTKIKETFGWSKLVSSKTENYFYKNGITNVLSQIENYEYDDFNKKVKSK